jgi:hypothetical protein
MRRPAGDRDEHGEEQHEQQEAQRGRAHGDLSCAAARAPSVRQRTERKKAGT